VKPSQSAAEFSDPAAEARCPALPARSPAGPTTGDDPPATSLAPGVDRPVADGLFLLGFMTLAVQAVLLRELFSVLYGSDLTFGFALAAWTMLTAAGALVAERSRRVPRGAVRWGLCAYGTVGLAVFLAVRAWGSLEVIPFHNYLLIPLFLAPLCLLGGMLFPWYLQGMRRQSAAQAYAWEVAGGLTAGLACAVAFHLGALACPFLLALLLLGAAWGLSAGGWRGGRAALTLAGLLLVLLPLTTPGAVLEKLSLRLRLRQGHIVAALNTPSAALVAVRDEAGQAAVYENGTPWPTVDYTPARAAVAAVLQALPAACVRTVYVQALRAGFGPALGTLPEAEPPRFLETDPLAVAFARQYLGGMAPGIRPLPFGARRLEPERGEGWDLVAVLSPGPGGLLGNRPLTREFAALVRPRLSAGGVFVVALPVAPGFTHPAQEAYIETVSQALGAEFPAFCELRTQVGWTLLVAGLAPLDRQAASRRLRDRVGVPPGVVAEALAIVTGAGAVSLDELAGGPAVAEPGARRAPANTVGAPRAYFRYLRFRGRLVEDAPGWWRWLFRERGATSCGGLLVLLLVAGALGRQGRSLQGVFWAAWSATLTLIFATYLYQSLAGDAFWAVALLSAASMAGILGGTRVGRCRWADWGTLLFAWMPAVLFPLYGALQYWPGSAVLALLLGMVAAAGACLGYVFSRRSAAGKGVTGGGVLFAVDLLGAGAGLFLGGVLLPWWSGFETPAMVGSVIACGVLAGDARRRLGG
jgi:hypothetical protein